MSAPEFQSLAEAARWYETWLREAALPLWASAGVDPATGSFREALTVEGSPVVAPVRARAQARQVFVYAATAELDPAWRPVAERGFAFYERFYRRPDGLFAFLADGEGRVLDDRASLYEQDFTLLALAALGGDQGECGPFAAMAERIVEGLQGRRHAAGGFVELGSHPFQANAHMHLLEAALAWEERGGGATWTALADEVVGLCLSHFIDPERGVLREFFDAEWRPAAGDDGRCVEPGHQFEWAWLLMRWGQARGEPAALDAAKTLFERGLTGVDRARGVAVNLLWDDLSLRDGGARLWPQTEYLKAALAFGEDGEALSAARGMARYLDVPARGAWRDKLRPDGSFVDEPSPATSFYHLALAVMELMKRR